MNNWISVNDRLPKQYQYVLFYSGSEKKIFFGRMHQLHSESMLEWIDEGGLEHELYGKPEIQDVTHWMELPEPPK